MFYFFLAWFEKMDYSIVYANWLICIKQVFEFFITVIGFIMYKTLIR